MLSLTSHVGSKWWWLRKDGRCDGLISRGSVVDIYFFLRAPPLLPLSFIPPLLSSLLLFFFLQVFLIVCPIYLYNSITGDVLSSSSPKKHHKQTYTLQGFVCLVTGQVSPIFWKEVSVQSHQQVSTQEELHFLELKFLCAVTFLNKKNTILLVPNLS